MHQISTPTQQGHRLKNPSRGIWWLHPSAIVFGFLLPVYVAIWLAGEYTNGTLSTAKALYFFKDSTAWLGLLGIAVLGVGTLSPIRPAPNQNSSILSSTALTTLGLLAILGYAYWFKDFVLRPQLIFDAIKGSSSFSYAIRQNLDKAAGLSSLAQLGLPYLIGYTYILWATDRPVISGTQKLLFTMLLGAIFFRAFAWAERVAIIEAGAAIAFVWAAFRLSGRGASVQWLSNLFPFIAGAAVLILFATGEYFRSWSAHYAQTEKSFWTFIFQRLANYYYNALNTGAGRLAMLEWPTYDFLWTLRWLHKLPIVGPIFSYWIEARGDNFLVRYGDPEFNNPSGLFSIYLDLGIVGGLLLMLAIGAFAKYFYMYWRMGRGFGGAIYFLFFMTLLEFFRYFYLGDSRSFMVVAGLIILLATSRRHRYA
jgi:hypothetical protein